MVDIRIDGKIIIKLFLKNRLRCRLDSTGFRYSPVLWPLYRTRWVFKSWKFNNWATVTVSLDSICAGSASL